MADNRDILYSKLTGLDAVERNLKILSTALIKKVNIRAVTAAGKEVLIAAQNFCPVGTRDETGGLLKLSLGQRNKTDGTTARTIVGPRRGFKLPMGISTRGKNKGKPKYKIATRYAHLIEFGFPGHPAHPYLRPAWDQMGGTVALGVYLYEIQRGLQEEVNKLQT